MSTTLDTFAFPDGVAWLDRYSAPSIVGDVTILADGNALFETADRVTGRPITLATIQMAGGYAGLFSSDQVDALVALHEEEALRTLTIGAHSFSVRWDRGAADDGLLIQELVPVAAGYSMAGKVYSVTARFRTA